jgi:hypothetical protein
MLTLQASAGDTRKSWLTRAMTSLRETQQPSSAVHVGAALVRRMDERSRDMRCGTKPTAAIELKRRRGFHDLHFHCDRLKTSMPDRDLQIGGKSLHMAGMRDDARYSIVEAGPKAITVSGIDDATGQPTITDLNFDGEDTLCMLT